MLYRHPIPALALIASLAALTGCPATPTVPKPTVHKSADPGPEPTTTTTTKVTETTPDVVKHAYFGKVLGADGKGVAGIAVKAYIVANNSGALVTDNGSGLITNNGPGLVTDNGSGVIANNAGNVISNDGASIKARHLLAADPTTTDANGEFKMEIPEGQTFNVEAVQNDNSKAFVGQVTSKTTQLDLTLGPTGSIHGKVAYPDDPKVTDFTGVDVFIPGSSYLAKTAADGSFTISNVPVGKFDLYATKRGLGGGHVEGIAVAAKGTAEVPVLPLKLLPIKLKALSATSGMPGQTITLTGDYFGAEQGLPFQVRLGGAVLENAKRDDKGQITLTLPDSARSGDMVVEVDGHASNGIHFDVLTGFYVMAPSGIEPGGTLKIAATATDPDKKSIPNPALSWKITNGTAATIDDTGTLKAGTTAGTVTVEARSGTLVASFKVVVGKLGGDGVGGRLESKLVSLRDLAFSPDGKTLYLGCQNAVLAYDLAADTTSIFAGTVATSRADIEGTGEEARFSGILGLAADALGNLMALEESCLVSIDKDRHVSVVAGTGKDPAVKASEDDVVTAKDGTGPQAVLEMPSACAFGKDGTFYFTDGSSIRTLVNNQVGHLQGAKDNINYADALCVDKTGMPWVMDFDGVHGFGTGSPTVTFAGDLDTSNIATWKGLVRTDDGTFYADGDDGGLYRIKADGKLTKVAGGDLAALKDGAGLDARFGSAGRLALGPDGSLYLAEETALRKISFADPNNPTVTTILQGTGGVKKVSAVKK